ncbi:malate dehydrogenase (quinone) [Nigerium massiliense]|uniref:malate dehydrogenase (quinone) n=1 Tax=Nigerium massiliense TaxID=1522317 RepID=UPI0009078407|nr:malate dehydrogenase (quinone) [Nigerium massiliense]
MSSKPGTKPPATYECDVALVGGGILSATFGMMLHHLQPDWTIHGYERLPKVAKESSNPWNNAGTGHSGLCELNYTPLRDGVIDTSKAVKTNEDFQVSRQLWSYFVENGVLGHPDTFINKSAHMSLVHGRDDIEFLRKRQETLRTLPTFSSMEFSEDRDQIAEWAPLLVEGRDLNDEIAVTWDPEGTDVNFGSLTRQFFNYLSYHGVKVETSREVTDMTQNPDGSWTLDIHDTGRRGERGPDKRIRAKFVFVGAGGWALKLMQRAGLPEVDGYGLFPVSGKWLYTTDPTIVPRHTVKVYAKPPVGAPPMSNPHMDARLINGARSVLFGPYAGMNPKFLKNGSVLDLPMSIRPHNIKPMLDVAVDNLDLVKMLAGMVLETKPMQENDLRDFYPLADIADWRILHAGQRAQIIKPDKTDRGKLEFGTEIITSRDGSVAGVLGASPGASTAVPIMLELLKTCFPSKADEWRPKLQEVIPTLGKTLTDDPDLAFETLTRTAKVLDLEPPTHANEKA